MKLTISLAQLNTRLGNVEANLEKHLAFAKEARASGSDLLLFPELSLTGYVLQDLASAVAHRPAADDPIFRPLLEASKYLDMVVGFVDEDIRSRFYIAAAYLSQGRVLHVHHKVYLPTYGLFDEGALLCPGGSCARFRHPLRARRYADLRGFLARFAALFAVAGRRGPVLIDLRLAWARVDRRAAA